MIRQSPHSPTRWRWILATMLLTSALWGAACSDPPKEEPINLPAGSACSANGQCAEGLLCIESLNQCQECIRDTQCADGLVCQSLKCVTPDEPNNDVNNDLPDADVPDADADTPDVDMPDAEDPDADADMPDVDDPDTDVEDEDAGPRTECEPGCVGLQRCDLENNTCLEPPICLGDADCLAGRVCFGTRCGSREDIELAGGCFDDASCDAQGDFLFCNLEGHTCLPIARCNSDNECPNGLVCDPNGLCKACNDDGDCPGGLVCDTSDGAFVCVEPDNCGGDDDCRGDRVCRNTLCTEPACEDDGLEPDNDCSEASFLESPEVNLPNRKICGVQCDWYSLDVAPGDGFVARIDHDPIQGDLDLTLHEGPCQGDDPGPLRQRSASLSPTELVSVPRTFNQNTYFFSVCPFITEQDRGTNTYELDVMYVEGGFCVDDVYDENSPNDIPTRASQITVLERPFDFRVNGLQVCPGAEDWYKLQVQEGDFLTVTIELNDTFGDLDLCIYSSLPLTENDAPLACSQGRRDVESVSVAVDRNAEYYINVRSPVDGQNQYRMNIQVLDECTDSFEDNDTLDDAADLSGLPPTIFNGLRVCADEGQGDEDWFTARLLDNQAVVVTVSYDENLGADISAEVRSRQTDPSPAIVTGAGGVLSFAIVPTGDDDRVFFKLFTEAETNISYTLDYQVRSADEICVDDPRANRTFADAFEADLGVREYRGVVCPDGNEAGADYFSVQVPAGTWLYAELQNAAPGLRVDILGADQRLLGSSEPGSFGPRAFAQIDAEAEVVIAVSGANADTEGAYLLQMYSQPVPIGPECTEDILEPNDAWDDARVITTGPWFRNLILCPTSFDWYKFFVIAGDSISITIQTHQPVQGAVSARVWSVFGPPFELIIDTVESNNGSLQINIDGIEVFDGGEWSVEIFSDSLDTVWYDLRVITN